MEGMAQISSFCRTLDEVFSMHDRGEVCKVLSNEFPALAVSVHSGTGLMENQMAKDLGGFHFHEM